MATEHELVRKVEEVISNYLIQNTWGISILKDGDVFAELYGSDWEWLERFNITELAKKIVRELNG